MWKNYKQLSTGDNVVLFSRGKKSKFDLVLIESGFHKLVKSVHQAKAWMFRISNTAQLSLRHRLQSEIKCGSFKRPSCIDVLWEDKSYLVGGLRTLLVTEMFITKEERLIKTM